MLVCQHLKFNVPWVLHIPLQVHLTIAKGRLCFLSYHGLTCQLGVDSR